MGLDMYLTRRKYIGGNYEHNQVNGVIDITARGKKIPIDLNKLTYIEESVGYWRKANAIHKWFVDNVQEGNDDCKSYYVSTEQLEELLNLCKQVIEKAVVVKGKVVNGETYKDGHWEPVLEDGEIIQNPEEIAEILPTQRGFFFGSTDYDEYYIQDVKNTINIIETLLEEEKALNEQGIYCDYEYTASW